MLCYFMIITTRVFFLRFVFASFCLTPVCVAMGSVSDASVVACMLCRMRKEKASAGKCVMEYCKKS